MGTVLVSTFGFSEGKVLAALRALGREGLVLIAGGRSLGEPGLARLEEAERAAGGVFELVRVDPFQFVSCFEGTLGAIRRHRRSGMDVRVNISGGTKVLADAALLAAFQEGVPAFHCEDAVVSLPVLRGVQFRDCLGRIERDVLREAGRPRPVKSLVEKLAARGASSASVHTAVRRLRDQGLLAMTLRGDAAIVSIVPANAWFVRALLES